jgi:hypothetical protein
MKTTRLFAVAVILTTALVAQAGDQAQTALARTAGTWEGELYYLDYQSGQRFGIPMKVEAEATLDGATVIRKLTFTNPGNLVYAANVVAVDRETGELVESFDREGSGEHMRYTITATQFDAADSWRIVYEHDGTDDGHPARIRHTIQRSGSEMTSTKAVRFLDEENGEFFVRNGSELKLQNPGTEGADTPGN